MLGASSLRQAGSPAPRGPETTRTSKKLLQEEKGEVHFETEPCGLKWPDQFDKAAVDEFVDAGHNGMICAGYLAKCGQKIMVVEKNMEVGGGLDSHEDRDYPGFWHNIHSVFHRGLMMLPWYKDLELENFGIHYYKPDPGVVQRSSM